FAPSLLMAFALAAFAGTAGAQLKLPRNAPQPAVPGAAPAPAPAASAVDNTEKEAAGKLAAQGWLVLLDRRDWGRAWETSSSVFRATVPLPSWMDGILKVRQELGTFVEREPAETAYRTKLAGRPDGEYVTVIFASKFDKRELEEV